MTANIDESAVVKVINIDGDKAERLSFGCAKSSSAMAREDENTSDTNVVTMSPSADTTLSTMTTKIEDQQNEMELFLLEHVSDDNKNCDNESCSASSTSSVISRYFEPTDFLPWEELYSKAEYAPHVGFAMVAGGFACLHPFVFFAGVVTAVGAARAAGATYDYAMSMQRRHKKSKGREGEDSSADDLLMPCDCFPTSLRFYGSERPQSFEVERLLSPNHDQLVDAGSVPPLTKSCSTSSTKASTIGEFSDGADFKTEPAHVIGSSIPSIIKSPRIEETLEPTRWVRDRFPVLPIIALENIEFRGLNAHEFFDVFFADDAPFGFPAFHKLRRDKEVQYSSWNTRLAPDDPNIESLPSITMKERTVQYHAKTNSFLGPAYAPTKKTQRAYFLSKKMLVIEIRMTLHDVPFSKQFYLMERWVIDGTRSGFEATGDIEMNIRSKRKQRKQHQHSKNDSSSTKASSLHRVYLTVSSKVVFTQECPFESAVLKESAKQVCEISKCWNAMAQAGLKRTEETRTQRLRQKEQQEEKERIQKRSSEWSSNSANSFHTELEINEGIEIEHIDGSVVHDHGGRNGNSNTGIRRLSLPQHRYAKLARKDRRQKSRSLSQSFSKLRLRGKDSSSTKQNSEKISKHNLKVRIFSAVKPNVQS